MSRRTSVLRRRADQPRLLDDGGLTFAGRELTAAVQATITAETAPIWDNLPRADVVAATRVLNEIITRARVALG